MGREELKRGERAAITASLTKATLAVLKAVVGVMAGSLPLIADSIHSASDVVVTAVSWISLRLAQRDPDGSFQYGYYKVEGLAGLAIAVLIAITALELMMDGINALEGIGKTEDVLLAATMAIVSVVVSFILARYLSGIAEASRSDSLQAISRDTFSDGLASAAVVLAIVFAANGIPYAEGAVSILIALLILRIAYQTGKDCLLDLLDVSPSPETETGLRELAKEVDGVRGVTSVRLRRAGPVIHGTIDVQTMRSLDVQRAAAIAAEVEAEAKRRLPELESLSVRVEPYDPHSTVVAIPTDCDGGLDATIAPQLGRAMCVQLVEVGEEARLLETVENVAHDRNALAGLELAKMLCEHNVDALISSNVGEVTFHTLRDCYVEVYRAEGMTVGEAIEGLRRGELELLRSPTKESGRS